MKKHFFRTALKSFFLVLGLNATVASIAAVPDSVYLKAYNVHVGSGLNLAWSADKQAWNEIGPLHPFIKSDFGTWGGEKKMYNPHLIRVPDGTWRCVFQVNDYANQFAVAYSTDLIKWKCLRKAFLHHRQDPVPQRQGSLRFQLRGQQPDC